jgi:hypothetical protein
MTIERMMMGITKNIPNILFKFPLPYATSPIVGRVPFIGKFGDLYFADSTGVFTDPKYGVVTKFDRYGKQLWTNSIWRGSTLYAKGVAESANGQKLYIMWKIDGNNTPSGYDGFLVTALDASTGNLLVTSPVLYQSISHVPLGINVDSAGVIRFIGQSYSSGDFGVIARWDGVSISSMLDTSSISGATAYSATNDLSGNMLVIGRQNTDTTGGAPNTYKWTLWKHTGAAATWSSGYQWAATLTSNGNAIHMESANDIAIDSLGNTFIAGRIYNSPQTLIYPSVAKLDSNFNMVARVTFNSNASAICHMGVDAQNNVWVLSPSWNGSASVVGLLKYDNNLNLLAAWTITSSADASANTAYHSLSVRGSRLLLTLGGQGTNTPSWAMYLSIYGPTPGTYSLGGSSITIASTGTTYVASEVLTITRYAVAVGSGSMGSYALSSCSQTTQAFNPLTVQI